MEEDYTLAKWLNNELSETELATFKASADYAKYEKIKNYSQRLKVKDFDENKLLETILDSKKKTPKVVSINKNWFLKIAAILVIGLGLSYFALTNFGTNTEIAMNGTKTTFLLPDNSEVVLNSGSEIEYKKWFWNNNRNLTLKGQAYFHVAKGKKFEVQTDLGKVAVLGTQFDVKARKNRFDVSCFEGKVKVNYEDKEVLLTKGMHVTFENGKQSNSIISSTKPYWLDNTIAFTNENLENIIDEIERQYDVTITLKNVKSKELFSGKIPSNNFDVSLQIIASTYKLNYSKISEKEILLE